MTYLFAFFFISAGIICPQTFQVISAENGILLKGVFDAAPFPHAERMEGHTYQDKFYSAEEHYSDNSIAVFIPNYFVENDEIDLVFYFHGWWNSIDQSIEEFELTRQFFEARANAILIIPEMPKNAPDSFGGKLEDKNVFADLIDDVLHTLQLEGYLSGSACGNIILAGHSGGYRVIAKILEQGGSGDRIKEVFLFDGLYDLENTYLQWLMTDTAVRFINIYTKSGGTFENSVSFLSRLKALKMNYLQVREEQLSENELTGTKVIFIQSDLEHSEVIASRDQFRKFLHTSFLQILPD